MLESKLENDYRKYVESLGLLYLKFSILGMAGFPDRIILGANKLIFFIEWKRPGKTDGKRKGEKLQAYRHKVLRKFGFNVYVLDNLEQAKEILNCEINK